MDAARAWAEEVGRSRPSVVQVVLFGSYAKGNAGVGSDLDLVVEVADSDQMFGRRFPELSGTGLPVPADILVYTTAELNGMRKLGRRFTRELDAGVVLWRSAAPPSPGEEPGQPQ